MATTYYMDFQNNTDRVWKMAMYQTLPNSTGLDSVSWLQTAAPQGGVTGVQWDVTYNVALANYSQDGGRGVYRASQTLAANLGTVWEIVVEEGVQQLKSAGQADMPQQIVIRNTSNKQANPGIGMSGSGAVFKNSVNSGATAQFQVTPTYYLGLFNDVRRGEVISSNVIVGPKKVQYPSGETNATVTANLDGNSIIVQISYGDAVSATFAEIDLRQQFVELSRTAALRKR
jgi:hypothetical protein